MHMICLKNGFEKKRHPRRMVCLSVILVNASFYDQQEYKHINNKNYELKSLGPIHFVKIRLSNFLSNEFLVKMYTL